MAQALGRYELFRRLGRGGMAEVYLARRRAAGVEKWLVVKRLRPERVGDVRFLELFVREARLSMSLAHQNIVPVFDFGRSDDQVFIAMERIEGKDLGSTLARAATLGLAMPEVVAAFVAAECCQALAYAHHRRSPDGVALGIVHRDVTPRNLLLSWSGEVKLTDFGIAALATDGATSVVGTPMYMAPEQARGESLDPRADIYALGMVLREALTGVRPRLGDSAEATLAAARNGELVPWPPGVAPDLVAIVDRATSADRDLRYPDPRTMLEDLDAFIVGARAARKTDAPTRGLAAWLGEVWKTDRDDAVSDAAVEAPLHAAHLVSFLDDGTADGFGTGTMRSMAMTAPSETAPSTVLEPTSKNGDAPADQPPSQPLATPTPSRTPVAWRWLAVVVVAVSVGVGMYALAKRESTPASAAVTSDAPRAEVAAKRDAGAEVVAAADAAAPTDAHASVRDAKAVATRTTTEAATNEAGSATTRRPRTDRPHTDVAPSAPSHTVLVNAKPGWAYFTIDDDPTQYQTLASVRLSTGRHVIHFAQGETRKDVAIAVPDNDDLRVLVDLAPASEASQPEP